MKVFAKAYWAAMLELNLAFFLAVLVLIVNSDTRHFGGNDVYIYFLSLFILFCLVNNGMVFAVIAVPFFMLVNKAHQFAAFYALVLGILVGLGNYGGVFVFRAHFDLIGSDRRSKPLFYLRFFIPKPRHTFLKNALMAAI